MLTSASRTCCGSRSQLAGSAGQPVPSITTLTQDHGVARQTAAKALQLLESEGLVYRVPGLGYYVSERQ